jgi:hypothetical protein
MEKFSFHRERDGIGGSATHTRSKPSLKQVQVALFYLTLSLSRNYFQQ